MSRWFRSYGFAQVHDNLVIGAMPLDDDDVQVLSTMQIRHVLNLVEDEEYGPGRRLRVERALAEAGIEEHRIRLTDFGALPLDAVEQAVVDTLGWLDAGERVYLHCRAGWQRSAAVAAGVLACALRLDIEEALERVQDRKPSADPLPHQRDDLRRWWESRGEAASTARG